MERKRRFRKPDESQHQWYKDQKYIVKQIIQKLMVVSKLKAVYVFIYLKSKLSLQNPDLTDITVRPGKACSAFHKLKKKIEIKTIWPGNEDPTLQRQCRNSTLTWIRMSERCKDRVERSRTFSPQMFLNHMEHQRWDKEM